MRRIPGLPRGWLELAAAEKKQLDRIPGLAPNSWCRRNAVNPPDVLQRKLLGMTSRSTYFKWKKDANTVLPKDTLEHISYILGIYKALQILLPDKKAADEWVRRPNAATLFYGQSALDRMLSGLVVDLFIVRQYLDAQRGGWA